MSDTNQILFISIEGLIGVGKSECMKALMQEYRGSSAVEFAQERVDLWEKAGILKAAYDNKITSGEFQQIVLSSLAAEMFTALLKPGVRIVISERSVYTNSIFAKVNLTGISKSGYDLTRDEMLRALGLDDGRAEYHMIYLKAPVEVVLQRISRRARESETSIKCDYLTKIEKEHEKHAQSMSACTIINANDSLSSVIGAVKERIRALVEDWLNPQTRSCVSD